MAQDRISKKIRLSINITQSQLARDAGVAVKTIYRMEKGGNISIDTFIRLLIAIGIQQNLEVLLPDPSVRLIDRIKQKNYFSLWSSYIRHYGYNGRYRYL